jgi:hypothetical protein
MSQIKLDKESSKWYSVINSHSRKGLLMASEKKKEPAKKEPQGEKNPDYLKGENHKEGVGPYSVGAQAASIREGYGPKTGWKYVDKGGLSQQDSLDINTNRPPSIRQLEIVSKGLMDGIKFPGLTPEFKQSLKNYQSLPEKFKKEGGPISTSMDKVQAYYKNKKR